MHEVTKQKVLDGMLDSPPHAEIVQGLSLLKAAGLRMVTLSNSSRTAVVQQIRNASLDEFFERSFSVDEVQRQKPSPEPYRMVADHLGLDTSDLRLVAAHGWDILAECRPGRAAAFVARPGKTLFPLVEAPDIQGADLISVAEQIVARHPGRPPIRAVAACGAGCWRTMAAVPSRRGCRRLRNQGSVREQIRFLRCVHTGFGIIRMPFYLLYLEGAVGAPDG